MGTARSLPQTDTPQQYGRHMTIHMTDGFRIHLAFSFVMNGIIEDGLIDFTHLLRRCADLLNGQA